MSIHQTIPNIVYADREVDVTDGWLELMDPENVRGESCTAYLKSTVPLMCQPMDGAPDPRDGLELIGISVDDGSTTIYRNRAWCQNVLGADFIWRVEQWEMEAA